MEKNKTMKWIREVRDRTYEETKGMSHEELMNYYNSYSKKSLTASVSRNKNNSRRVVSSSRARTSC